MNPLSLKGKKALISGASRGIGLAIAHALARAGADIAICARQAQGLTLAQQALQQHGQMVEIGRAHV